MIYTVDAAGKPVSLVTNDPLPALLVILSAIMVMGTVPASSLGLIPGWVPPTVGLAMGLMSQWVYTCHQQAPIDEGTQLYVLDIADQLDAAGITPPDLPAPLSNLTPPLLRQWCARVNSRIQGWPA